MKFIVKYEEWTCTFPHPSNPMGRYFEKTREFASREAANGFVEGIKSNKRIKQHSIRIVQKP